MQILGIESSSLVASVALWKDDCVIAEYTVNHKKTHSQTLLPMLGEIVSMTEYDLAQVDAIALSNGPGSFTGLRIGSATAKGLGLALHKPIIEVPTVAAMAFQCFGTRGYICPIMDARRNQVYTGIYRFTSETVKQMTMERLKVDTGMFETVLGACAMPVDALMQALNALEEPLMILGDGVPVYRERMLELAEHKEHFRFAPSYMSRQRAAAVAALGAIYYEAGLLTVDARQSAPDYLRKSQAERELEEKSELA